MKKSDFILIGVVVVLLIIAFLTTVGKGIEKVTIVGETGLKELAYADYNELIDNEEPFLVVIERTGCSYCQKYMPILEQTANKMQIAIYYIDIANLSEDEQNKLTTSNNYLSKNEWGTPTTLLLKGTEDLASLSGYVDEDKLEKFINKYIELNSSEKGEK